MTFLKKRKSTALFVFAVLTAISVMLHGCTNTDRTLIETVPANVKMIATVNMDKILKNAGCRFNDGNITLSSDLMTVRNTLDNRTGEIIDKLIATAPTIDITQIIAFTGSNNKPVITFTITNPELFDSVITSCEPKQEKNDKLTVYDFNDYVIATDGSQGWITNDIKNVTTALEESSKNNFRLNSNIIGFIDNRDTPLAYAINTTIHTTNHNTATKNDEEKWICTTTTLSDNLLGVEITAIDSDGQQFDFTPYISDIDTDFLNYIPDNTQMAIAIGQLKDIDGLYKAIAPLITKESRKIATTIMSYLKAIDGTTAVAINPIAGAGYLTDISPKTWDFTLMTHMPQSNIDALSSLIGTYTSASGIKTSSDGNQSIVSFNGIDINYGSFDGYFIASTRDISPSNNNTLMQAFNGKLATAVIDIPHNSETMKAFGIPNGIHLTISVEDTSIKSKFRFNGSSDPILTTIAAIVAKNITSDNDHEIVAVLEETVSDDIIPENLEPVEETR